MADEAAAIINMIISFINKSSLTMHPARKFSQNLGKNKNVNIESLHDKENQKGSVTESFAKKFSVGNHLLSNDDDFFLHKKSINDEKISVFLEHSQNKTFALEKIGQENDVRHLNRMLQTENGTVLQILQNSLDKNDLKSEDMRNLVYTLVEKLSQEQKSESSAEESFKLTDHIMRPYLEQQIVLMQQNLSKLKKRESEFHDLKSYTQSKKKLIKQNLMEILEEQKRELQSLKHISCC